MEAMWIKDNADPFEWVGKVMNITGGTMLRGAFKVNNVVVTDIKSFANKITSVKVKDEDGCDYIFTSITEYEVVKKVTKSEFKERASRKHQPRIDQLRFKLDKQYRNTNYGEPLLLKKSEITQTESKARWFDFDTAHKTKRFYNKTTNPKTLWEVVRV